MANARLTIACNFLFLASTAGSNNVPSPFLSRSGAGPFELNDQPMTSNGSLTPAMDPANPTNMPREMVCVKSVSTDNCRPPSLQDYPGGETVVTWSRRLKIVSGVAKALASLHDEYVNQRVIHRDVKSSNIMLDRDFNARLGDLGRSTEHDKELLCTAVAGTRGYMAPELGMTCKPTENTDVYSFGAVVLEVATGKKPMLSQEDREALKEVFLVDWVWGLYRDDALLNAAGCILHNAYDLNCAAIPTRMTDLP
ncbi:unnamed protein product [Calypogeia fissa]